jgi:hypothetical protein
MSDWSGFHEEAHAQKRQTGGLCGIKVLMKTLPEDARPHVEAALNDASLSSASIERGLRARIGADAPTAWVIRAHRRGDCRCERSDP